MLFTIFKNFFARRKQESEMITDLLDAVEWIKTYQKSGNYDTAIMAGRELMLKIKSALTYNEAVKRKIIALKASNIDKVAKAAKGKQGEIERRLTHFYKWERILSNLIHEVERKKAIEREKEIERREKNKFSDMEKEIKGFIKKRDLVKAMQLASALVSTFEGNSRAISLLVKVRRLNEKQKGKTDKQEEMERRMRKFFEELGAELRPKDTIGQKKLSFFEKFKFLVHQYRIKSLERSEYLKEQRTLKKLEELLVRSGGISGIGAGNEDTLQELHAGTARAVGNFAISGYDFFGKIIGKDRIVGDTFGSYREGRKTTFYFGDATGHGIQAGFTVAELSKIFTEYAPKKLPFVDLFVEVNNQLKERLKGRVFVTAVFLEHDAEKNELRYIGAGHDPIFVYRSATKTVEKIIPGGLALGVRPIKNASSIKIRTFDMAHRDVIFGYTDGIIESRDLSGKLYWVEKLSASFSEVCGTSQGDPGVIFDKILSEVKKFAPSFEDDVSGFVWVRNTDRDVIVNHEQFQDILNEVGMKEREARLGNMKNKTRAEVAEMLKRERHTAELRRRLAYLDRLYQMGEFLKLKQKIQENVREGYVDEKMSKYLKKILEKEDRLKVSKLEEKIRHKYNTLKELHKKWENEIVIREIVEIITRWGKI